MFATVWLLSACNQSSFDEESEADRTPPTTPTGLQATAPDPQRVQLQWNASTDSGTGVAAYRVFRSDLQNAIATVTTPSHQDTTVTAATTYSYYVTAVDGASPLNESAPSALATVLTPTVPDTSAPSVPFNLQAVATGPTQINLTWNASTDAGGSGVAGYRIFRNGSPTPLATVTATSHSDINLTAGTTYSYTLRAFDVAGNVSAPSSAVNATTLSPSDTTPPPAPTGLTAVTQGAGSVALSWTGSTDPSGIQRYEIQRAGVRIADAAGNVTTFLDSTVSPATTYSYAVRAIDGANNVSAFSNTASATTPAVADTTPPTVPGNLIAAAAGSQSITLTWNASTDAGGSGLAGYRIFRAGVQVAQVGPSVVTFTDTGLTPNAQYAYLVRAFDADGNVSNPSNQAQATTNNDTTAPSVPTNVAASSLSSASIRVTWIASTDSGGAGLAGYRVFRGGVQIANNITGTTFNDSGLSPSTTYQYAVRAFDNAGNVSGVSSTASATTAADTTLPSAPGSVTATATGSTNINIAWIASTDSGGSGVAGYRVFRDGTQIASGVTATAYADSTVLPSTTYAYVVRAVDNAGNVSNASNSAQATTPATQVGGLDVRPSNTTCLAPAQPTTNTSVSVDRVFPGVSFTSPILMAQAPGEPNRWYVVEQRGTIQFFDTAAPTATPWADLQGIVNDGASEAGLLGMAFHPGYATNGRVFLSYTGAGANPFQSHISEFRRGANGLLDPTTERIVLRVDQPFDNHNGGHILFGPDGNLYIGFGDGGSGGDPGNRAQNRNLLLGKLLRINVDGATPYTIPSDNPYAGNPLCSAGSGGAPCPEIYAYGLRNPWRWSFDRASSEPEIWLGDVGQNAFEEVDRIERGGNYGWRIREAAHCFNPPTGCQTTANGAPLIDPVAEYGRSLGASITGGYVYRGSAIPSLRGRYVFGDFITGRLFYLAPNAAGGFDRLDLATPGFNISSFAEDGQGELYITDYGGGLHRINLGTGTIVDTIPANLADTGCVNAADPTQPASGLIPFAPNAAFWSDGAAKVRWMGLPNGQTITIGGDGDWSFPNGTVLVKNFRLGNQLLETRLFMRHPNGNWGGYTYQWNAAQTAATLVKGGLIAHVTPPGQDWIYPSEAQCLQCHTSVAGRSLGLETAQLNSDLTYPATGRTANQLLTLNAIGTFSVPLPQPPNLLPSYPDPYGATGTVTERARAYLHTNCSQCHRPTGPTPSNMDLRYGTAIGSTATCNATPASGDLGIANARLIAPGDASQSMIWLRMSRRDSHQMPPLGSNLVDAAGAALIQSWINALNASCQ